MLKDCIPLYIAKGGSFETQTMQRFHKLCHCETARLSLRCAHTHTHCM